MSSNLGTRLVSAGLVTRKELGLALALVPAHGGALLAELVRNGVEEEAIAGFFVADGFGPVIGDEELAEAGSDGWVPPQLAVDMLAIPLSQGRAGLRVAMADPSDVHAVRELAHAAGGPIVPLVARISALLALLAHRYPNEPDAAWTSRQTRASEAPRDEELEGDDPVIPLTRVTGPPKGRRRRPTMETVDWVPDPERPDTAEFGVLPPPRGEGSTPQGRRRRVTARSDSPNDRAKGPATAPGRRRRSTLDVERPVVGKTIPPGAPNAFAASGTGPSLRAPRKARLRRITANLSGEGEVRGSRQEAVSSAAAADDDDAGESQAGGWGELSEASAADGIARRAARAHAILPGRLSGPSPRTRGGSVPQDGQDAEGDEALSRDLTLVLETIRVAETREVVCRETCLGLAPLGRCAVLLVLVKGVLEGREVAGGDLPKDVVRNLRIPSTSRSLLQRVVETREPYLGPHGGSSADAIFRAALSGRGGDVLLMPVVLSGRAVAVLALDEPITDRVVLLEQAELLTRATARAFERLELAAKR
ncbi:MAG: hypothetical protein JRH11_13745 [Deltaproteobacteria bacterium]|nr:hypothetical protein [Deltaproteobacteria bacterium]